MPLVILIIKMKPINIEFKNKILKAITDSPHGLTITQIVDRTKLSRDTVRMRLAQLEGENLVKFENIGKAKVYRGL